MRPPDDPFTAQNEGAVVQHELFKAWVAAGFTDEQALELLKAVVTAMIRKASD